MRATGIDLVEAKRSEKRARWNRLGIVSALIVTVICGCVSGPAWKRQTLALNCPSGMAASAAHTNVMSLRRVVVSPLFADRSLVYRTGTNTYERDPYAELMVSPDQMLEHCIRGYLRQGGAFAEVLEPGSDHKASYWAEVFVDQLCGDFRQPNRPVAVLQLRFVLYSAEADRAGQVLWQKEFLERIPLPARTSAGVVAGWDTGLREIMNEVNAGLSGAW